MPKERHNPSRRIVFANEDDHDEGEFSYIFYDQANPHGKEGGQDRGVQNSLRTALSGLRGQEVLMKVKGERRNAEGRMKRFTVRNSFVYNNLAEVFGPGGAYLSAIDTAQSSQSDSEMVTLSVEFESLEEE